MIVNFNIYRRLHSLEFQFRTRQKGFNILINKLFRKILLHQNNKRNKDINLSVAISSLYSYTTVNAVQSSHYWGENYRQQK